MIDNMNMDDDLKMFDDVLSDIALMKAKMSAMATTVKQIRKKYARRKIPNIKSGFVKPVKLSPDLSSLIGTPGDELISRSVVNKKINEYIKANNLQVEENKQTFVLDNKLANLFNLDQGSVVHYFKMQTYLKTHYPKDDIINNIEVNPAQVDGVNTLS